MINAFLYPDWIIPTRVGTRESTKAHSRKLEDHPHACGDKAKRWTDADDAEGSSPRVWGQGGADVFNWWVGRIIPTRVGTRSL